MPKVGALVDSATDTAVNQNNDTLEAAFQNTISRDGSTPNQMNADLDMNGNDILNVRSVSFLTVNGLPAGGTAGQVLVKDSSVDYDVSFTGTLSELRIDTLEVDTLKPVGTDATVDIQRNTLNQATSLRVPGGIFVGHDYDTGQRKMSLAGSSGSITLGWDRSDTTSALLWAGRARVISPNSSAQTFN